MMVYGEVENYKYQIQRQIDGEWVSTLGFSGKYNADIALDTLNNNILGVKYRLYIKESVK